MSSHVILQRKRPRAIGPEAEGRTLKQQSDASRRARAQWGPKRALPKKADDSGVLTWNSNGTLQTLAITDHIPGTSDTQTCNYLYDDLQRLSSSNCGALWGQNFTYDAFGDINKSVPAGSNGLTFAPVYTSANQFYSIPGVTVKYDTNGNLLTDNLNTYTWDGYGKMATVSTGSTTVTV
jgi:hypothetical protein